MTGEAAKPARPRRWRRRLLIALAVLVALVVGGYFVVTSSGFLRWAISGAVADATGADVTIGDVDCNLFSRFTLTDLTLTGPPLESDELRVGRLAVEYSLMSVIRGAPQVGRVELADVEASVTKRADGTLALMAGAPSPDPSPEPSGETPQVTVGPVEITDVRLRIRDETDPDEPLEAEVMLSSLRTGGFSTATGVRDLAFAIEVPSVSQGEHTSLSGGRAEGTIDVQIGAGGALTVAAQTEVSGFEGRYRDQSADGIALRLESSVETDADGVVHISAGDVTLTHAEAEAGRIGLSGDYDPSAGEGHFEVTLANVTDRTLELLWAQPGGVDCGDSRAEGHATVALSAGGRHVEVEAALEVSDLSVRAEALGPEHTPPLDFDLQGLIEVDMEAQTLRVSQFQANGDLEARRLLEAALDQPMTIAWGSGAAGRVPAAQMTVALHDLDLARMRPLLPAALADALRAGVVNANGVVGVAEGGQRITATGTLRGQGLEVAAQGRSLPPLALESEFEITTDTAASQLSIGNLSAAISRAGGASGTLDVAGDINLATGEGDLQVQAEEFDLTLPAALLAEASGVTLTSGAVDTRTEIALTDGGDTRRITTHTSWSGLNVALAAVGDSALPFARGRLEGTATLRGESVDLASLTLDLGEQGSLSASGQLEAGGTGQITYELSDIDMSLIGALAGEAGGLRVGRGRIGGEGRLSRGADDLNVTFNGLADLGDWGLASVSDPMPPVAARTVATASLVQGQSLTIDPLRVTLQSEGEEMGALDGQVSLDLGAGTFGFQGEAQELNLLLAAPLLPEGVGGGRVSYTGRLSAGPSGIESEGTVNLTDLAASLPGEGAALRGIGLTADHSVTLRDGRVALQRAEGSLTREGQAAGGFSANADVALDPLAGSAQITLSDAALGGFAAVILGDAAVAGLVANGTQDLEFDLTAKTLRAEGEMNLRDALRVATEQGPQLLTLAMVNHVSMDPSTIVIEDTRVTASLGNLPPQTTQIRASVDRTGSRVSTFGIFGGRTDLTPYRDLFTGGEPAPSPAEAGETAASPLTLPDPGPVRLQGDVIFEELVWGELTLVQPEFGLRWERLSPEEPAREISLNAIDVQIQGQEKTGRLTGDVLALQDSDDAPLSYSLNLELTETEFASVLTEFAPQLLDSLTGTVAMPSCQFSGEGASFPDDLERLTGSAQFLMGDGELSSIPLLNSIVGITGLTQLERLRFFEGGATLRAAGDHMELTSRGPFFVRGDLTLLTATGDIFYDGRQSLHIALGLSRQFPGLGGVMERLTRGRGFPESPQYPGLVIFPLPIRTTGTWGDPSVRFGAPQFDQVFPGLVGEGPLRDLLQDSPLQGVLDGVLSVPSILGGSREETPPADETEETGGERVRRPLEEAVGGILGDVLRSTQSAPATPETQ